MKISSEKQKQYYIPPNYEDNFVTYSGRSTRNVVEAVLFFAFFLLIFIFIPIPLRYRVILIILFGVPAAVFGFIGIEHCSVTEYLGLVIKYKSRPDKLFKKDLFKTEEEEEKTKVVTEDDNKPITQNPNLTNNKSLDSEVK